MALVEDCHWEDVKARLRKAGVPLSAIARDLGVDASVVSRALRLPVSERVDREVARRLGVNAADIWPSRYTRQGSRIRVSAFRQAESAAA